MKARPARTRVALVDVDDWTGLYINGQLAIQNHSLSERHVLEALAKAGAIEFGVAYVDEEWLNDRGDLPESLADVVFAPRSKP